MNNNYEKISDDKKGCGKYLFTRPLEHELGGGSEVCGVRYLCNGCN